MSRHHTVPTYTDHFRNPKAYGQNPVSEDFCPHLNENIMRALFPESIETTYRENYIDYSGYYKRPPLRKPPKNSFRLSVPKDWVISSDKEQEARKKTACKSVYGSDFANKGPGERFPMRRERETADLTDGQPEDNNRYRDTTTGIYYCRSAPNPNSRDYPCSTCHYYHSGPAGPERPPAGLTCVDMREDKKVGPDEGCNRSSNASSNPYFDNLVETYARYKGGLPRVRGVIPHSALKLARSAMNVRPAVDWFHDSTPPERRIPSKEKTTTTIRDKRFVFDPPRRRDSFQVPERGREAMIRNNRSAPNIAAHRSRRRPNRRDCEDFVPEQPYSPEVAFKGRRRPQPRAIAAAGNKNCHRRESGEDVRVCRNCQIVFKPPEPCGNKNVNQGDNGYTLHSCPTCCRPIKPPGVSVEVLVALLKDWQEKNVCPHCGSPIYDLSQLNDAVGECSKTNAQYEAIREVADAVREAQARGDCYGVVETVITGYYFCNHDQECCNPVRSSHAATDATGLNGDSAMSLRSNERTWGKPLNQDRFRAYNIACTKLPHAQMM